MRNVAVEQLNSWSACRIRRVLSALAVALSGSWPLPGDGEAQLEQVFGVVKRAVALAPGQAAQDGTGRSRRRWAWLTAAGRRPARRRPGGPSLAPFSAYAVKASVAMDIMAMGCIDWGKQSKSRSMPTWGTSLGSRTLLVNSSACRLGRELSVHEQVGDFQERRATWRVARPGNPGSRGGPASPSTKVIEELVGGGVGVAGVKHGQALLAEGGDVYNSAAQRGLHHGEIDTRVTKSQRRWPLAPFRTGHWVKPSFRLPGEDRLEPRRRCLVEPAYRCSLLPTRCAVRVGRLARSRPRGRRPPTWQSAA